MLRHAALRIARPPVGARLARPAASRQKLTLRPGAGVARRVATARPTRPLMLPKAPRLLACRVAAARPLSSTPPPLEEEEKAPAAASERIQHFVSNLTVADAARNAGSRSQGQALARRPCEARADRRPRDAEGRVAQHYYAR